MGRVNDRINRWICDYMEREGALLDEGRPSSDVRKVLWILERTARKPKRISLEREQMELLKKLEQNLETQRFHPALMEMGYIGRQSALPDVRFGKRGNTADHGCGWISVYNALLLLGNEKKPSEVLASMERGARGKGKKGLDPFYVMRYFRQLGYETDLVTGIDRIEPAAGQADAFILCYLFRRFDNTPGGHFVAGKWSAEDRNYVYYNGLNGGRAQVEAVRDIPCIHTAANLLIAIKKSRSI